MTLWYSNLLPEVVEIVTTEDFNSATCSTGVLVHDGQYETTESLQACKLEKVALIVSI